MRNFKKIIALISIVLMVLSSSAIITSASENYVYVNNFNPLIRYWHYGAYPDKVNYTTGGYATLESTHYDQQHQVCFYGKPVQDQWNTLIKEAVNNYDGIVGFDVYVKDCYGTNKLEVTDGTGHEQGAPGLNVIINFKYKDKSGKVVEEDLLNFEAPVGQVGIGQTKHFMFPIDEDLTQYDSFEITRVKIAVINYACLANENGEQGCGDLSVRFSPFYVEGTPAPRVGIDLGENFNSDLYSWESTDKVTTISQGNLTPDGPLKGGVDLKRNNNYLPYLADGVTVVSLNGTPITTTTTVAKPATPKMNTVKYVASGTNRVYWYAAKNAKSYKVYRKVNSGSWTSLGSTTKTYFDDKKATTGGTYYYKVVAVNGNQKSSYSSYKYIKVMGVANKPVIKLSAGKKYLKVAFKTKVTNATGYRYEYSLYSNMKSKKTSSSATIKGLKSGKYYYVRSRAYKKVGSKVYWSKYSSIVRVKVK